MNQISHLDDQRPICPKVSLNPFHDTPGLNNGKNDEKNSGNLDSDN